MAVPTDDTTSKAILSGVLTWIVPGAGHYLLGHRGLAGVFFLAISIPYWTGLAIGGVTNCVNVRTNKWLFLAELGIGGYTTPCYVVSRTIERNVARHMDLPGVPALPDPGRPSAEYTRFVNQLAPYVSYYPESDVATIYLATAGLLNLLAILDAITRAQTGGLPTFHRELLAASATEATS